MTPTVTRCVSCGMEGYDIAPRAVWPGKTQLDGRRESRFCRWCYVKRTEAMQADANRVSRRLYRERFLLGPCPCQGCGRRLYWRGWWWMDTDGIQHRCSGKTARKSNAAVENSLARVS